MLEIYNNSYSHLRTTEKCFMLKKTLKNGRKEDKETKTYHNCSHKKAKVESGGTSYHTIKSMCLSIFEFNIAHNHMKNYRTIFDVVRNATKNSKNQSSKTKAKQLKLLSQEVQVDS